MLEQYLPDGELRDAYLTPTTYEDGLSYGSLEKCLDNVTRAWGGQTNLGHVARMLEMIHWFEGALPNQVREMIDMTSGRIMTLLHDSGECRHGDMPVFAATRETPTGKAYKRMEALVVRNHVIAKIADVAWRTKATECFDEYEARNTPTAHFVKWVDVVEGHIGFLEGVAWGEGGKNVCDHARKSRQHLKKYHELFRSYIPAQYFSVFDSCFYAVDEQLALVEQGRSISGNFSLPEDLQKSVLFYGEHQDMLLPANDNVPRKLQMEKVG